MIDETKNIRALCEEHVSSRALFQSVLHKDGKTWVKVTHFPADEIAGESMWVILVDGDENNGTGTLDNKPIYSDIELGSLIEFADGDEQTKPHFVRVVEQ